MAKKFTKEVIDEIKRIVETGIKQTDIAKAYGVHFTTINKMVNNRAYLGPQPKNQYTLKNVQSDIAELKDHISHLHDMMNKLYHKVSN